MFVKVHYWSYAGDRRTQTLSSRPANPILVSPVWVVTLCTPGSTQKILLSVQKYRCYSHGS